jgi:hypothetical protein
MNRNWKAATPMTRPRPARSAPKRVAASLAACALGLTTASLAVATPAVASGVFDPGLRAYSKSFEAATDANVNGVLLTEVRCGSAPWASLSISGLSDGPGSPGDMEGGEYKLSTSSPAGGVDIWSWQTPPAGVSIVSRDELAPYAPTDLLPGYVNPNPTTLYPTWAEVPAAVLATQVTVEASQVGDMWTAEGVTGVVIPEGSSIGRAVAFVGAGSGGAGNEHGRWGVRAELAIPDEADSITLSYIVDGRDPVVTSVSVIGESDIYPSCVPPEPTPAALPDTGTTPVDEPITLDVLSNDSLLTTIDSVSDLTPTESGAVEVSADAQSVQFTPTTGWTGTARFAYTGRAADGKTASATAVVTVVPDAAVNPVAVDDVATVAAGETVTTVDVLANDRLPNGVASVAVKVAPAHGTAIVNGDGTVAYTVVDGYTGVDRFVYQVTDNLGLTSSAPVAITVVAPPVVVPEPPTPAPTPTPVAELVPAVTRTTVHVAG